jgi:hypothetical protein
MSLQQLINEFLKKEQESYIKTSDKFYPSLLGRCFRLQILNRAGIPPSNPPDERTLRIFKCGGLFHDFVQKFLPENQVEVPCETDDFKGRADIVTEDSVYDIKSVHSNSFWYSSKETYDIKKEKYHNWLQLAFYGWVLKKPKLVLVQISKDDLCINEYADFTEKWLDNLQHEINLLKKYWNEYPALPLPEPRFKNECKYCNYLDYCKGVDGGYKPDIDGDASKTGKSSGRSRKPASTLATK